jgi:hypothetical protein
MTSTSRRLGRPPVIARGCVCMRTCTPMLSGLLAIRVFAAGMLVRSCALRGGAAIPLPSALVFLTQFSPARVALMLIVVV